MEKSKARNQKWKNAGEDDNKYLQQRSLKIRKNKARLKSVDLKMAELKNFTSIINSYQE